MRNVEVWVLQHCPEVQSSCGGGGGGGNTGGGGGGGGGGTCAKPAATGTSSKRCRVTGAGAFGVHQRRAAPAEPLQLHFETTWHLSLKPNTQSRSIVTSHACSVV